MEEKIPEETLKYTIANMGIGLFLWKKLKCRETDIGENDYMIARIFLLSIKFINKTETLEKWKSKTYNK